MKASEVLGQQAIAGHRHKDAGLTELENQNYRSHPGQSARADKGLNPGLARDFHGRGNGSRIIDEGSILLHSGQHS